MRQNLTLHAALAQCSKATGYERAKEFLDMDLTTLRTADDFARAHACLNALFAVLAPKASSYRLTIVEMRKLLEAEERAVNDLPSEQFYRELDATWREVCESIRPHIPEELWAEIGGKMSGLFRVEG